MAFFTDPSEFTHYGDFYGFPAYFANLESDGPMVAGTNVIWDWMILNVAPHLYALITFLHWLVDPFYESPGWLLHVRGELPK